MADEQPAAVVTGANRGIGLEVYRQLAAHGYAVALGSRAGVLVNAVCPGWTATDMGGAGGFFRDGKPIPW
jgi:NAD(P)-dependent dehydrogenase (short-subunit alcohol dehydrogenase family)